MSKVVKSVGKAVGKVVKGVTKVVKGVVKGVGNVVKKIAKSPIGKALLIAATVYFGGAAIIGGIKGAAAGSGFLGTLSGAVSGAGAGITSAWNGLVGAGSALMGGQGLGAAGQSLSSGFMGQAGAGAAQAAGSGLVQGAIASPVSMGTVTGTALPAAGAAGAVAPAAAASSTGAISGMWNSLGPYGKMAAIQGGTQLVGGLVQGVGAQKQQDALWNREDQLAADELARREANMSGRFMFGEAGDSNFQGAPGAVPGTPAGSSIAGRPRYVQAGLINGVAPNWNPALDYYGQRRLA
jgi:hypothetical protein